MIGMYLTYIHQIIIDQKKYPILFYIIENTNSSANITNTINVLLDN